MASKKVVVITGASSGIGAALAQALSRQGHKLVLAARRKAELEQVAKSCGANAIVVPTDVTRRAEVEHLRDEALKAFGRIDVWVNNAGRGITRRVLELTDEDVDQIFLVNTKSALYGMQAIIPYFQKHGEGHLINVSSFLARIPLATHRSIYSAAKAALNSLTANLRMDLAREYPKIQVSVVMPGIVETEFARNALGGMARVAPPTGPMKPQKADEVALMIADLIEHPKPEFYTNPASHEMAKRYYEDVGAFEAGMRRR